MKTYKAICTQDYSIEDAVGQIFSLQEGEEYIVSELKDGKVTVFSTFWVNMPAWLFSDWIEFTK